MSSEMLKTIAVTLVLVGLLVVVPIVAILLEHQQKMAKLIRGERHESGELAQLLTGALKPDASLEARIEALEAEVRELKSQTDVSASNLH